MLVFAFCMVTASGCSASALSDEYYSSGCLPGCSLTKSDDKMSMSCGTTPDVCVSEVVECVRKKQANQTTLGNCEVLNELAYGDDPKVGITRLMPNDAQISIPLKSTMCSFLSMTMVGAAQQLGHNLSGLSMQYLFAIRAVDQKHTIEDLTYEYVMKTMAEDSAIFEIKEYDPGQPQLDYVPLHLSVEESTSTQFGTCWIWSDLEEFDDISDLMLVQMLVESHPTTHLNITVFEKSWKGKNFQFEKYVVVHNQLYLRSRRMVDGSESETLRRGTDQLIERTTYRDSLCERDRSHSSRDECRKIPQSDDSKRFRNVVQNCDDDACGDGSLYLDAEVFNKNSSPSVLQHPQGRKPVTTDCCLHDRSIDEISGELKPAPSAGKPLKHMQAENAQVKLDWKPDLAKKNLRSDSTIQKVVVVVGADQELLVGRADSTCRGGVPLLDLYENMKDTYWIQVALIVAYFCVSRMTVIEKKIEGTELKVFKIPVNSHHNAKQIRGEYPMQRRNSKGCLAAMIKSRKDDPYKCGISRSEEPGVLTAFFGKCMNDIFLLSGGTSDISQPSQSHAIQGGLDVPAVSPEQGDILNSRGYAANKIKFFTPDDTIWYPKDISWRSPLLASTWSASYNSWMQDGYVMTEGLSLFFSAQKIFMETLTICDHVERRERRIEGFSTNKLETKWVYWKKDYLEHEVSLVIEKWLNKLYGFNQYLLVNGTADVLQPSQFLDLDMYNGAEAPLWKGENDLKPRICDGDMYIIPGDVCGGIRQGVSWWLKLIAVYWNESSQSLSQMLQEIVQMCAF